MDRVHIQIDIPFCGEECDVFKARQQTVEVLRMLANNIEMMRQSPLQDLPVRDTNGCPLGIYEEH